MRKVGLRLVLSSLAWLLSLPATLVTFAPAYSYVERWATGKHPIGDLTLLPFVLLGCYAWVVLLVMNIAWLRNKKIDKWLPVSGTVSAIVILFGWVKLEHGNVLIVAWAFPGILFASALCAYHLEQKHG